MVALHQCLEPGLDLLRGGIRLEAERVERLALGIAHRASLGATGGASAGGRSELLKHSERIIGAAEFGTKAGGMRAHRGPAAVHAHLPGRAMPDDGLALIAGNVVGAHAGEKIVGVVVLADVVETEPPVFALA